MDMWGMLIVAVFCITYFLSRKKSQNLAQFSLLMSGVCIGLVIGAAWAASIVSRALSGY